MSSWAWNETVPVTLREPTDARGRVSPGFLRLAPAHGCGRVCAATQASIDRREALWHQQRSDSHSGGQAEWQDLASIACRSFQTIGLEFRLFAGKMAKRRRPHDVMSLDLDPTRALPPAGH